MPRTASLIFAALMLAAAAAPAAAQPAAPDPAPSLAPRATEPDPDAGQAAKARRMNRARFSGKRLAVEILAGTASAVLTSYGTFAILCEEGDSCFGAAFASLGVELAISPLVIHGTGRAMGGRGKLSHAYLGALPAFSAFSVPAPIGTNELAHTKLQLAMATLFLPVTSALMAELSSHVQSIRWAREHAVTLSATPVHDRTRTAGAMAVLSAQF